MIKLKTTPTRSKNMSAIRGKGNHTTELRLAALFRKNDIYGWRRHPYGIYGRPDFIFRDENVVIFVDGCFWHGCREIKKFPSANRMFWLKKLKNNQRRDLEVNKKLRKSGWRVIRLWEHDLERNPEKIVQKIRKAL